MIARELNDAHTVAARTASWFSVYWYCSVRQSTLLPRRSSTLISHNVFYWKIHLVLDRDTFRLVDYGQSQSRCHLIKRELHFMAQ